MLFSVTRFCEAENCNEKKVFCLLLSFVHTTAENTGIRPQCLIIGSARFCHTDEKNSATCCAILYIHAAEALNGVSDSSVNRALQMTNVALF